MGRVRDLRGIDEQPVPVNRQRAGIPHRGQQHTASGRLLPYLLNGILAPVSVFPERTVIFPNFQRVSGAERHAPLAVHAPVLLRQQDAPLFIEAVNAVWTLLNAQPAAYAALPGHE